MKTLAELNKFKTLKVTKDTYEQLSRLGTLQDSYDSVIRKLINIQKGLELKKNLKLSQKQQQPFHSELEIELNKIDLCWHQGQTAFQEGQKSIRKIAEMLKLRYGSSFSTKYIIEKMIELLGHLNGISDYKLKLYLGNLK